jgi:ribosome recycling factor
MYSFDSSKKSLEEATDWLSQEYSQVHTGTANPIILDGILVESYGEKQPIKNIASITIEDPKTLRVSPWDATNVPDIEKAISDSSLGLSVSSDSAGVRISFPQLTEETRKNVAKVLKGRLEEARVTVRKEREKAIKDIDTGEYSDDEKKKHKENLQKIVDSTNQKLEGIYSEKEANIMTI